MARTAETLRLAIPRRACSPAFSGYSPSTVATPIPRPSAPSSSLADSLTLTTPDVFGLDERFLDPLTAHPFCVSFLARAIEAIGPNPRCCPRPRWRATPYCNGSGAGTAQSRSALSMPNQTLSAAALGMRVFATIAGAAKALSFPVVQDPEAPPIRPERHVENSIATMRKRLTVALARSLYRCPCCHSFMQKPRHARQYQVADHAHCILVSVARQKLLRRFESGAQQACGLKQALKRPQRTFIVLDHENSPPATIASGAEASTRIAVKPTETKGKFAAPKGNASAPLGNAFADVDERAAAQMLSRDLGHRRPLSPRYASRRLPGASWIGCRNKQDGLPCLKIMGF